MKYTQAREIVESALDALLNEALVESTKNAKSRYRKAVRALGKNLPKKIEPFKPMDNPFTKPFKDEKK
jgi:hypothetical protein